MSVCFKIQTKLLLSITNKINYLYSIPPKKKKKKSYPITAFILIKVSSYAHIHSTKLEIKETFLSFFYFSISYLNSSISISSTSHTHKCCNIWAEISGPWRHSLWTKIIMFRVKKIVQITQVLLVLLVATKLKAETRFCFVLFLFWIDYFSFWGLIVFIVNICLVIINFKIGWNSYIAGFACGCEIWPDGSRASSTFRRKSWLWYSQASSSSFDRWVYSHNSMGAWDLLHPSPKIARSIFIIFFLFLPLLHELSKKTLNFWSERYMSSYDCAFLLWIVN